MPPLTYKGILSSRKGKASTKSRHSSDLKSILKELKDLQNKQANTAKRMETLLNEAYFLVDKVNVRISQKSTTKSLEEQTYETSPKTIQQQLLSTPPEFLGCNNSYAQVEKIHPKYGHSGEKQAPEKLEESGISPIWNNYGYTREDNGSTAIWDTNPYYSTTLTDPGLKSPICSNYLTDTFLQSPSKEASRGGRQALSTSRQTLSPETGTLWQKKNTRKLYYED